MSYRAFAAAIPGYRTHAPLSIVGMDQKPTMH